MLAQDILWGWTAPCGVDGAPAEAFQVITFDDLREQYLRLHTLARLVASLSGKSTNPVQDVYELVGYRVCKGGRSWTAPVLSVSGALEIVVRLVPDAERLGGRFHSDNLPSRATYNLQVGQFALHSQRIELDPYCKDASREFIKHRSLGEVLVCSLSLDLSVVRLC